MKKLIIIPFLLLSMQLFAQVTKSDFEAALGKMGVSQFKTIFLNNVKTFYTDGTSAVSYSEYEGNKSAYELTSTSILLKYYSDETKTTLSGITTVPYSSVKYFITAKESMTILLKD